MVRYFSLVLFNEHNLLMALFVPREIRISSEYVFVQLVVESEVSDVLEGWRRGA